jgi:hypothetical protein
MQIWFTRYVTPVEMKKTGQETLGWAYVGSANLSESAWWVAAPSSPLEHVGI